MNKKIIIFSGVSIGIILFGITMTIVGLVKLSTVTLHRDVPSKVLNNERNLIVYLPPGYELSFTERYPVLYILDGELYFKERKEESKHKWSMKKTLDRLVIEEAIPKMIVVGIYSSEDRTNEYTPIFGEATEGKGKLDDYAQFVINEVKPFIDMKYRTLTEPEHNGIAGKSLGGLASLYIGWKYPDVFSKVGAMSPYLQSEKNGSGNEIIINELASSSPTPQLDNDLQLWMDIGLPDELEESSISEDKLRQELEKVKLALVSTGNIQEKYIHISTKGFEETTKNKDPEEVLDQRLESLLLTLYGEKK
jgi:predicted alpha/beta superfamily hydrolase